MITPILDQKRRLVLDGGTGTLLQAAGLAAGELPESWNIKHPERIAQVHRAYFEAGCDIVCTNTFGVNSLKHKGEGDVERLVSAAVSIANAERKAAEERSGQKKFVLLDVGPLGRLLRPFGDLDFEKAVSVFAKTVRAGEKAGVDAVFFETFTDVYELKAAILAAKENSSLPIFASCAFDESGHLMTGADPLAVIAMCEGLGVDALGVNCGVGPAQLSNVISKFAEYSSLPIIIKPNAGLPRSVNGETVFDLSPEAFAEQMKPLAATASFIGGCCGTTPDHIAAAVKSTEAIPYRAPTYKVHTLVSSYSHAVELGKRPTLIGERINPTGKKAFKEALRRHDIAYILARGSEQASAGAEILDVNVGLPEINEAEMMLEVVESLQSVLDLPLQIDSTDPVVIEKALRRVCGKPLINSVNGKPESLSSILPLAKKYGGVVVGLTLDENGIPDSAQGRFDIAERIVYAAAEYGIDKKNIIIDPLTLTVATDPESAKITLDSLRMIRERLGVGCCLGVSNISFGLPDRDRINSVFFTLAMDAGLTAAIMNPLSEPMMRAYRSYLALMGFDEGCVGYISSVNLDQSTVSAPQKPDIDLRHAIISGLREITSELTAKELERLSPMEIINGILIPSLSELGERFAQRTLFLPQLLMSAEAAGAAFEVIREKMPAGAGQRKEKIILATVKGDIHDIGKNIVRALLDNYNYEVIDLGRDVPVETIVEAAKRERAYLVGLSALMTTTVPAMEETVKALHDESPDIKVMVGGAVLTQEYADMIGADHYAPDALAAVNYAETLFGHK